MWYQRIRPNLLPILLAILSQIFVQPPSSIAVPAPVDSTTAAAPPKTKQANAASFELNEKGVKAIQANDFIKAESLFRKAVAADRYNLTAAYNLAGVYLNNKRQTEAISLLNSYIKEFSKDPGLYARRGDVYFSMKDIEGASKDYQVALQLDPQYPTVAGKLATIYTLLRRTTDAEKMLLKAVEQEPKNGQLLQNLSSIFLTNGKANEAVSTAKRALQVAPNSEIYVTLGNAYEVLGDTKNSLISFQRASDLGDVRPELKAKIEELKKVSS